MTLNTPYKEQYKSSSTFVKKKNKKKVMMDMEQTFAKRGRLEIIREILTICCIPAKKTSILYRCNLSFSQLQKYLEYLIRRNLLNNTKNDGKTVYIITDKGKEFLEEYEHLNSFLVEEKNTPTIVRNGYNNNRPHNQRPY